MKQVYLDNAATTPVRLEVEVAMRPYFVKNMGILLESIKCPQRIAA